MEISHLAAVDFWWKLSKPELPVHLKIHDVISYYKFTLRLAYTLQLIQTLTVQKPVLAQQMSDVLSQLVCESWDYVSKGLHQCNYINF